jgi:hypothetical protein
MYCNPKWQFCKITHPPETMHSSITALAFFSYPSPIDTFLVGNFFFFLASSSIVDVGSDPGLNNIKTGVNLSLAAQIVSIGYDIGLVNS